MQTQSILGSSPLDDKDEATLKKRKTSVVIDNELWKQWTKFVIDKTGSARKLSQEVENAIREYMKRGVKM